MGSPYGKPYPYGCCLEITLDVLARLRGRLAHPNDRGARALRAFLAAGGVGHRVWGALRGQYFQNALQFGGLYVDVSNDTVTVTKPKVDILPMARSGLEPVRGAEHFAQVAEAYWGWRIFANHALPSLAPILPLIGVPPGGNPQLESATGYMVGLFRQDGFAQSEAWLVRGPVPPTEVVEALRARCPADLLAANPQATAAAAVAVCCEARTSGVATSKAWLDALLADYRRIHPPPTVLGTNASPASLKAA